MVPEQTPKDISSLRISRHHKESPGSSSGRWKIVAVAGAVVLLGAILFVYFSTATGVTEVDLVTATLTSPSQASAVLTASGYVVAQVKASVASKGTGRLVYLGVEEGDEVSKGQILARLEDDDIQALLARARAELEVSRADFNDASRNLDRQTTLFASDLTSQAELDAAQARFERVRAMIAAAEAAVTEAEVALENTRIRAPFDGTVLTKNADLGEIVAPFASSINSRGAVVTMADMGSLQVEADVSESNIMRVSPGQRCEIALDAYQDRRYPAVVHKIVPTADRAKATVMVKVRFLERDERVLPEMSAKVTFLSGEGAEAAVGAPPQLMIPSGAVLSRGESTVVLRVGDGIATEVPVTLGERIGDRVVVTGGLSDGDRLILSPDASLATGSRVQPRER